MVSLMGMRDLEHLNLQLRNYMRISGPECLKVLINAIKKFCLIDSNIFALLGEVQNLDREVKKCLIEAFKKTDEEFLQQATASKPTWKVCSANHCIGKLFAIP